MSTKIVELKSIFDFTKMCIKINIFFIIIDQQIKINNVRQKLHAFFCRELKPPQMFLRTYIYNPVYQRV